MSAQQKGVLLGIALCALGLLLTVSLKPSLEEDFHQAYVQNLNQLMALTGELERDELHVQMGFVQHYDFVEASLQDMQKRIRMVGFMPSFVDKSYRQQVSVQQTTYRRQLQQARDLIEVSKRLVGLLRNSKRKLERLFKRVREQAQSQPEALLLLSRVQQQLQTQVAEPVVLKQVRQLVQSASLDASLSSPLLAHVGIVARYQPLVVDSSRQLNQLLHTIQVPRLLRTAYQNQFIAHSQRVGLLSWVSQGLGVGLLGLCLWLIKLLQSEKRRSEQVAEEIEAQMQATHLAVDTCNGVLSSIARGQFDERVTHQFDGALARLCEGVNKTAAKVEEAIEQLCQVMRAVEQGRFHARMREDIEGALRTQVESAMNVLEQTHRDIAIVMDDMREGRFVSRVEVRAEGELAHLKSAVNESMQALQTAIAEINTVMHAQAQGDLSLRIERELPGQLGQMREAVNTSVQKLSSIVKDLQGACRVLAAEGDEVERHSQLLSSHSGQQVAVLAETLEATECMTQAIVANRDLTQVASRHATAAKVHLERGEAVAQEAEQTMSAILSASEKINDVTSMIGEIAFQTNMLALNAAVEAARAERHGAGFTVVAREVGTLAQRCTDSSVEIHKLVERSVEKIGQGVEDVRNTGEVLQHLSGVMAQVNNAVDDICAHCDDQSRHIAVVNESISQVDALTQHNSDLADQSLQSAQRLSTHATKLQQIVTFFRE